MACVKAIKPYIKLTRCVLAPDISRPDNVGCLIKTTILAHNVGFSVSRQKYLCI